MQVGHSGGMLETCYGAASRDPRYRPAIRGTYELGRVWYDAVRDGLVAADHRATADGLTEADVRVAFFGDLFRPPGAMAGGEPPYTPADVSPARSGTCWRLV